MNENVKGSLAEKAYFFIIIDVECKHSIIFCYVFDYNSLHWRSHYSVNDVLINKDVNRASLFHQL